LSESNITLQDCYYGYLAHFHYTSLSKLEKKFSHSTLVYSVMYVRDVNKGHLLII